MELINKYYVYTHCRKDTGDIFYVGIGSQSTQKAYARAYNFHCRTKYWKHIYNKTEIIVNIVFESNFKEHVYDKEIQLIEEYGRRDLNKGTLVNLTDGGEKFSNLSKEVRESRANKIRGMKRTDETREKFRVIKLNQSKETKRKISESHKNVPMYSIRIPIIQYDLNGNFIKEWPAAKLAGEELSISPGHISSCCKGKRKTIGKFKWQYKNLIK